MAKRRTTIDSYTKDDQRKAQAEAIRILVPERSLRPKFRSDRFGNRSRYVPHIGAKQRGRAIAKAQP